MPLMNRSAKLQAEQTQIRPELLPALPLPTVPEAQPLEAQPLEAKPPEAKPPATNGAEETTLEKTTPEKTPLDKITPATDTAEAKVPPAAGRGRTLATVGNWCRRQLQGWVLDQAAPGRFLVELLNDVRRGDLWTCAAVILLPLGIIAALIGSTRNEFVNLLIAASSVLLGWLLRIGVERIRGGRGARLLGVTLAATVFFACGWWGLTNPRRSGGPDIGRYEPTRRSSDLWSPSSSPSPSRGSTSTSRGSNRVVTPSASRNPRTSTNTRNTSSSAERRSLDRAMVGRWRQTNSQVVRVGSSSSLNLASDVYCQMNADGTFYYGGGQTAYSAQNRRGSGGGQTGGGGVIRGQWSTSGGVLYSKTDGAGEWIKLGRYAISGNAMVIYPVGGGKQFWER